MQRTGVESAEKVGFALTGSDVGIGAPAAFGGGAVVQRVGVVAVGMEVLRRQGRGKMAAQFVLEPDRGVHQTETAGLDGGFGVETFVGAEGRTEGAQQQDTGRGQQPGRLAQVVGLSVGQADALHIVQREAAEVYLAGLGIGEGHAVVGYGGVGGAEAAYGDGLQSADAAVVLHHYAAELLDGIRHLKGPRLPQGLGLQGLQGGGGAEGLPVGGRLHDHLVQPVGVRRVDAGLCASYGR